VALCALKAISHLASYAAYAKNRAIIITIKGGNYDVLQLEAPHVAAVVLGSSGDLKIAWVQAVKMFSSSSGLNQ